jgi:hypothetical protein
MPLASTVTFEDVEVELVRRITALDATAYTQGNRVATWHEALVPLSVLSEAQSIGHMAFNVFVESGRNSTDARDRAPDGAIKLISDIAVLFAFHIRGAPTEQIPDQRRASNAAIDLARAVLAMPQADFQTHPVSLWRPQVSPDGEWMVVRLDFLAIHEIAL